MGGAIVAEFVEEVMWLGRYNIQLYAQGFTLSKRGEPPFVNNVDLTPINKNWTKHYQVLEWV